MIHRGTPSNKVVIDLALTSVNTEVGRFLY